MDTTNKLPPNTFSIHLTVRNDEELIDVGVSYDAKMTIPPEEQIYFQDVLRGMAAQCNTGIDYLAFVGMTMRHLTEADDDGDEIEFEAATELLDAMKDSKVVSIKKKLH